MIKLETNDNDVIPSKTISSPNFPGQYQRDLFCQWHVRTESPLDTLRLKINTIDLEYEDLLKQRSCADHLYIFAYGTDVSTN